MNKKYILNGKTPVQCDDDIKWREWYIRAKRHVAKENLGKVVISTIFLGIDHGFNESKPVLFETMVFGGSLDQEQDRFCTWDDAEAGHKKMVERVKASQNNG